MSYILDALKKSEQERHQDSLPDPLAPAGLGIGRRRRAPVWPWILAITGVATLASGVTFWWVTLEHAVPETAPAVQHPVTDTHVSQPASVVTTPRTVPATSSTSGARMKMDTATVRLPAEQGVQAERPMLIQPGQTPVYLETEQPVPAAEAPGTEVPHPAATAKVPKLTDLPKSFQQRVPDLVFNSHIYSPDPSAGRVMINNRYLRPGQTLSGMILEAVTEEGVILNLDGMRFEVPVVRNWTRPE